MRVRLSACDGTLLELVHRNFRPTSARSAGRVHVRAGNADVAIPPGSTTVEIDLTATTETTTVLRLVHRGLDDLAAGAHHGGWTH